MISLPLFRRGSVCQSSGTNQSSEFKSRPADRRHAVSRPQKGAHANSGVSRDVRCGYELECGVPASVLKFAICSGRSTVARLVEGSFSLAVVYENLAVARGHRILLDRNAHEHAEKTPADIAEEFIALLLHSD